MPHLRPTLTQLRAQVLQDVTGSTLPGADGLLDPSVLRVLALAIAGLGFLHYDYQDWIAEQSNPWSATDEYALAWGALIGVGPKPASVAGNGQATFTGAAGADVPPGTGVTRSDGRAYASTADAVVGVNGLVVVPVASVAPGAAGNTAVGALMTLTVPVPGVVSAGRCTLAVVGGSDAETMDAFKGRYLAQYAAPPQGGDAGDYVAWARAVAGVTRAWVLPQGGGPGTVVVYTMFDQANAASLGFPVGLNGVASTEPRAVAATGDNLTVANAIKPVQPVTALVYAASPTPTPVPFQVSTILPFNPATTASITAALVDMFLRLGQVGGTTDPVSGADNTTIFPSAWDAAVASVPGLTHFTVVSPVLPIKPTTGQLFVLGSTTYTA